MKVMPDEPFYDHGQGGAGPDLDAAAIKQAGMSRFDFLGATGLAALGALTAGSALADTTLDTSPKIIGTERLKGKKAVVTGAARGIGRAVCEAFAKEGADVLGIDIAGPVSPVLQYPPASRADFEQTGKLVTSHGRKFITVVADVRDIAALRRAADQAEREFGGIDIVVANAGIQTFAPIWEMNDHQWQDIIDVNLGGVANTLRAFSPGMIRRKKGRFIITASGQGRKGTKHGASYSASKWAVLGLMKSAAIDLGEFGITVNAVDPGLTDTLMTRNAMRWREAISEAGKPAPAQPTEAEVVAVQKPQSTLGVPWVQPNDIAPVFVFLASDDAAMISASAYDANAGQGAHNVA